MARENQFTREQYSGTYTNEDIISLEWILKTLHKEKLRVEKEIEVLKSQCDHMYYFSSSGAYEDNYVCIHCGHETER